MKGRTILPDEQHKPAAVAMHTESRPSQAARWLRVATAVSLLAVLITWGFSNGTAQEGRVQVNSRSAGLGDVSLIEGITEPYLTIDLAAAEPDVVGKVYVTEGEPVRRGQLLAELDLRMLSTALKIALSKAELKGQLELTAAEYDYQSERLSRLEKLRETGHARETEVWRAKADTKKAEANVLAAKESRHIALLEVERMQAQLERRRVRSPIAGVVSKIYRNEAEFVTLTDPKVFTVLQLDPLRATFAVPGNLSARIAKEQSVTIRLSSSGKRVSGVVEFVAPVNDAESGTTRVKVLVNNKSGHYRSGERCRLEIPRSTRSPNNLGSKRRKKAAARSKAKHTSARTVSWSPLSIRAVENLEHWNVLPTSNGASDSNDDVT